MSLTKKVFKCISEKQITTFFIFFDIINRYQLAVYIFLFDRNN